MKTITINGVNFTEVKGAKAERLRVSFRHMQSAYSIYALYERPSQAKINAWDYCENVCTRLEGYNNSACGNTCTFSYAFMCLVNGINKLVYITKDNNYICDLF